MIVFDISGKVTSLLNKNSSFTYWIRHLVATWIIRQKFKSMQRTSNATESQIMSNMQLLPEGQQFHPKIMSMKLENVT